MSFSTDRAFTDVQTANSRGTNVTPNTHTQAFELTTDGPCPI